MVVARPDSSHLVRPPDERVNWPRSIPFLLVHLLCFAAIWTGISLRAVVICLVLYWVRAFCITAGYHRYFAHKSYQMNRFWSFLMAFGGTMSAQKGPLWWAAYHRQHHRYSDTERDIHSPRKGFWWSHVGWILCDKYKPTDFDDIRDFAKYPELRWLDKYDWVGPWMLGIACFLIAGWSGLVVGFFWSTVLLWHATFTVNSLAHVWGRHTYVTRGPDTSRNNAAIAFWTMGEGWHNNHHYYPASTRQGFRWWQFDATFCILWLLALLGIAKDLRVPSREVIFPPPEKYAENG